MRRISVEEVKAAYEKTGLRPIQTDYVYSDCGCPVAALYCLAYNESPGWTDEEEDQLEREIIGWAKGEFGDAYLNEFVRAVDSAPRPGGNARSDEGYADGLAVRKAIFETPNPPTGARR